MGSTGSHLLPFGAEEVMALRINVLLCGAMFVTAPADVSSAPLASAPRGAGERRADIEVDTTLQPRVADSLRARATVDIDASARVVRDAILDLDARVADGWMVDAVAVYRDETSSTHIHRRARWELSILGFEIVYHCTYDWNAQSQRIEWGLDPAKPNDLDHARGVYELAPGPQPDTTRLTYTVEVGSKHRAAQPIKRRVTKRNVSKLLASVRERAEARR